MRICKIVLCLCLLFLLCSCTKREIVPSCVIGEALAGCTLPSGQVCTLGESRAGKQSDEDVFRLLFDGYETGMAGVRCSSMYLSAREDLCEMAVFLCYGDTMDTVDMCRRRGEFLARNNMDVQYMITVKGKCVLFAVGQEPKVLMTALGRALDG